MKKTMNALKSVKTFGMMLVVAALPVMTACGGKEKGDDNSVTLEIKSELGDLDNFISLDNSEVTISLTQLPAEGDTVVKMTGTIPVTVNKAVASDYSFDFEVEVLDKDQNRLASLSDFEIEGKTDYDAGDFNHYLPKGSCRAVLEKKGSIESWKSNPEYAAQWEEIKVKGKYLVLKPNYGSAKYQAYTGASSNGSSNDSSVETEKVEAEEVSASTASASTEDWDKILDEYEAYCTKLATYAKKAQAGDVSAISEYASLLQSAESLQRKLESAKDNMSAAQAARLNQIATKMAQSMM